MDYGRGEGGQSDSAQLFALPSLQLAAHELKAPLALVRQLAQAIESGNYSTKQIQQLAGRIGLTSDRALRLTTDLTRTTRLSDDLFELEPLDPVAVCRDIVGELKPLYEATGRQLRLVERQISVPLVVGNRDLLSRIMINFADNALHYAESDYPTEVSLVYRRQADTIRLAVRDYGPSLTPELRAGLRGKGRLPSAMAYRPASSGLGLYVARQFAEFMGAKVGAVAHRDGASFYVDVPRSVQLGLW